MEAEFLEALRILCSSVAVALNNARLYQDTASLNNHNSKSSLHTPLSEQISNILTQVRLTLVGTEKPLNTSCTYILLKTAEILKTNNCNYCRLTYGRDRINLEAMLVLDSYLEAEVIFSDLSFAVNNLSGKLQIDTSDNNIIQIKLSLPYELKPKTSTHLCEREREVIQLLAARMRDRALGRKNCLSAIVPLNFILTMQSIN